MKKDCRRQLIQIALVAAAVAGVVAFGIFAARSQSAADKTAEPAPANTDESDPALLEAMQQPNEREETPISKERLLVLLNDIAEYQRVIKHKNRECVNDIARLELLSPLELYKFIKSEFPEPILERNNISKSHFESLIQRYESEPEVVEAMSALMRAQEDAADETANAADIGPEKIISVLDCRIAAMNEAFEILARKIPNELRTNHYDTMYSQLYVNFKIYKVFGLYSSQVDLAIAKHENELQLDEKFIMLCSLENSLAQMLE